MEFKIDTKNNYSIVNVICGTLDDKLADYMFKFCQQQLNIPPGNLILEFDATAAMQPNFPSKLANLQEWVYENEQSIAYTGFSVANAQTIRQSDYGDSINLAPTLQEAIDIINMDVVQREMFGDETV